MKISGSPSVSCATRLRETVETTLLATLGSPQPVALVNFPNHGNPGDPAIWLGTRRVLERLGCVIRYQSNFANFDMRAFNRAHPDGPVLINGGGNFGDMYQGQQGLRERLFRDLRDRRIIQLPQSVHFRDAVNVRRMASLIADHGDVTLMLREERSHEFAREHFDAALVGCPDMAFGLILDPPAAVPQADLVWIVRSEGDPEWCDPGQRPICPPEITLEDVDWTGSLPVDQAAWKGRSRRALTMNRLLMRVGSSHPSVHRWGWRALGASFEPLASAWVNRGLGLLGRGRVVVTDRLHGHILAVLLGMPHVVLDNSTGKVRATLDTYTSGCRGVVFAESSRQALTAAIELLDGGTSCSS